MGVEDPSNTLKCTKLACLAPDDAVIKGIKLSFCGWRDGPVDIIDESIRLIKDGSVDGNDKSSEDPWNVSVPAERSYGDETDLWGLALTPADVKADDFGVAIRVTSDSDFATVSLNALRVTVYWE